jgi:hypothetical protein
MKWAAVITFGSMGFYAIMFDNSPWWGVLFLIMAAAVADAG